MLRQQLKHEYRSSIDSEGAAVDVAGLCAFGVHQEACPCEGANQHAFPGG